MPLKSAPGRASIARMKIRGKSGGRADASAYAARAAGANPFALEKYRDMDADLGVLYKTADGEELRLDIALPPEPAFGDTAPLVLEIHGGGWDGGSRYNFSRDMAKALLRAGVAFAAASYRLVRPGRTVRACAEDVKDAARFLAKNASLYGLDTRAFALFGHSAGGHLALLTALSAPSDFQGDPELAGFDPTFACAAAKAPVTTFFHADHFRLDMRRDRSALERLLGAPPSANQAEARALSPISYISKDSPATLLLHGDADNLVTWKDSALFHTHAKKAGAKCELEIAKGGDHLFLAKDGRPALRGMQRRIDEFLITRLTAAV